MMPVSLVVPSQRLELMSRHRLEQLREDCAIVCHELESPLSLRLWGSRMISKMEVQALKNREIYGTVFMGQ